MLRIWTFRAALQFGSSELNNEVLTRTQAFDQVYVGVANVTMFEKNSFDDLLEFFTTIAIASLSTTNSCERALLQK